MGEPPHGLDALWRTRTRLESGEHFRADDPDELVMIEDGIAVVRGLDEHARDGFVIVRRAPSILGLERLGGAHCPYELSAVTDVTLAQADRQQLREVVDRAAPEHRRLVDTLIAALGSCVEDRISTSGNALVRVARLLLSGRDGGIRVSRLPRALWAEILDMRPETLSRTLRRLDEEGVIDAEPNRIAVRNPAALEKVVATGSLA